MVAPAHASTKLDLDARAADGSRSARRLRRTGLVPGIIYGGGGEPELFKVDGRILRNTLARSGAILDVAATSIVIVVCGCGVLAWKLDLLSRFL